MVVDCQSRRLRPNSITKGIETALGASGRRNSFITFLQEADGENGIAAKLSPHWGN
jgi:hypothetical protein